MSRTNHLLVRDEESQPVVSRHTPHPLLTLRRWDTMNPNRLFRYPFGAPAPRELYAVFRKLPDLCNLKAANKNEQLSTPAHSPCFSLRDPAHLRLRADAAGIAP